MKQVTRHHLIVHLNYLSLVDDRSHYCWRVVAVDQPLSRSDDATKETKTVTQMNDAGDSTAQCYVTAVDAEKLSVDYYDDENAALLTDDVQDDCSPDEVMIAVDCEYAGSSVSQ